MEAIVIGCGVVGAMVACLAYAVYGGRVSELSSAKVGDIYNFVYEQPKDGTPERYLAKVVGIRMLNDTEIRKLNNRSNYRFAELMNGDFKRSRHLVTCQTSDGKIRNFYAERTKACRKPLLAPAVFGTRVAAFL